MTLAVTVAFNPNTAKQQPLRLMYINIRQHYGTPQLSDVVSNSVDMSNLCLIMSKRSVIMSSCGVDGVTCLNIVLFCQKAALLCRNVVLTCLKVVLLCQKVVTVCLNVELTCLNNVVLCQKVVILFLDEALNCQNAILSLLCQIVVLIFPSVSGGVRKPGNRYTSPTVMI